MADSSMLAAAKLLEPLAERVGHLEHVTQVLQLQLARLTESVLVQLDGRMRTMECDLLKLQQASQVSPANDAGTEDDEEEDTGGQVPNPQISLVVSQSSNPSAMVTVEMRARDKVQDLKIKAHEQLSVWMRLCNELGEQEELPPLKNCRLSRQVDEGQLHEFLEDRKRLGQCGLENGEELQLTADVPQVAMESRPRLPSSVDEETDTISPIVNLMVAHHLGEVNIEARRSETVLSVKKRSLEQLEVWCRFTDVCNDGNDATAALPPLEASKLYASGSGDGVLIPQPLDDRSTLAQCGLQADGTTQNALVTAAGRVVQWRSALFEVREFQRWSVEPDVITRNSVAAALRQHWRWGHLFLHQVSKDSRDLLTYNTTLSGSGPGGSIWRLSLAVLDELLCDGLLADPFSFSANNACEASGEWQQTQHLLRRLPTRQIRMNVVAFNSTVSTLDKSSEWQSAQFLLCVLRSKLTQAETTTFNAATSACQKSGKWQNAQAMLAELQARDIPSDVITYSSVISATEEGSQWRQVQSLMREVQYVSFHANLVVFNAAISACARAGRTRLAISFYRDLQKEQLEADAITYESLLSALHQGAQFQSILYFLQVVSSDNVLQLQAFNAAQGRNRCCHGADASLGHETHQAARPRL
eukprot:s1062_g11.t1